MKIAIDARMYGNEQCTGIGTYIKNLTENLFEIDQENEYILFLRKERFETFTPPNERVKKSLVTSPWYSYQEQFKLPFEFNKEKFDFIHYPHFNSPILYPKKSVCTIHDITPIYFPGHKMNSLVRKLGYKAVFRATLQKANTIIAVSASTKKGIMEHFNISGNKIKITYEGVDDKFQIIPENGIIEKTKQMFGITKPFLFYVGVWRSHKNLENLVKAFEILKNKYKIEHQLVLGGREDLHYTKVREQIEKSNYKEDIITPGYIQDEDLPLIYNAAEMFVLPSFIEGFGIIILEAQKCGCPVAASNSSSIPEVMAESGIMFDPHSPENMAEKIFSVLNNSNKLQELKTKGLENVKRFTWRKCAEKTLDIYKQIL